MHKDIEDIVESYLKSFGSEALIEKLSYKGSDMSVLTIIANAGVHPYHQLHKRGEVFIASRGNLDFSSEESAVNEISLVLDRVAGKLKERRWEKVYLVPFGPAPLSLQIKSLVHKVLDIETIDVLHAGEGKHFDIKLDPRKIALNAASHI